MEKLGHCYFKQLNYKLFYFLYVHLVSDIQLIFRYVGRSFDSLVNTLTAIQTIDADDVIIPASWKPGDKTIKNTPDGVYDYYGISGNTITTGSLVQSEKAKSSVKYSESGVDKQESAPSSDVTSKSTSRKSSSRDSPAVGIPSPPSDVTSKSTSRKSSSSASPVVIIPAPAPSSSAKSSKSSLTKASSVKSPKHSTIKEASVKSESSKTSSKLGSERGLEVASIGSKKESSKSSVSAASFPSKSTSTPSKPASPSGNVSTKGIIISGLVVLLGSLSLLYYYLK